MSVWSRVLLAIMSIDYSSDPSADYIILFAAVFEIPASHNKFHPEKNETSQDGVPSTKKAKGLQANAELDILAPPAANESNEGGKTEKKKKKRKKRTEEEPFDVVPPFPDPFPHESLPADPSSNPQALIPPQTPQTPPRNTDLPAVQMQAPPFAQQPSQPPHWNTISYTGQTQAAPFPPQPSQPPP